MLRICGIHGCATLTLGEFCVAHEESVPPCERPRGRPFRPEGETVCSATAEGGAAIPPATDSEAGLVEMIET